MIIQPSISMSPGQPLFEFHLEFRLRHEKLEPGVKKLIEPVLDNFFESMHDISLAHAAQPKIPEGTWYLRHTVEAARQDVSACAARALEVARELKRNSLAAAALSDLADYAITFTERVHQDPCVLSIQAPKPPNPIPSPEPPII